MNALAVSRVDQTQLKRRLQAMARGGERGGEAAAKAVADVFVDKVEDLWSRDTNKSIAGWVRAANESGLTRRSVPAIVDSKYHQWLLARLEDQVTFWKRVLGEREEAARYWERTYQQRYAEPGRKGKWERDAAAKKRKAVKNLEKVRELVRRAEDALATVAADPTAVVIWGKGLKQGVAAEDDLRFSRIARGLNQIYGGRGTVVRIGERTYIRLHNLEPHTSIVEAVTGVVRTALAEARGAGLRQARGALKKEIRAIAGGRLG